MLRASRSSWTEQAVAESARDSSAHQGMRLAPHRPPSQLPLPAAAVFEMSSARAPSQHEPRRRWANVLAAKNTLGVY